MSSNSVTDTPALILVVDDDKSMRMLLRLALEQEGYLVAEAKNGEECLASYRQQQPALILLDAVMPVMDGFTCCTQLRHQFSKNFANHNGVSSPTSILMITVLDDVDSVEHAFEVGASDYITKPINWAVLRHRVRRLIQQSAQTQQIADLMQQLEVKNKELQTIVRKDKLTQLANQQFFQENLRQEWLRMARERSPLSLIVCDIDYLNSYNNTYSYEVGNNCLQELATIIHHTLKRPADLAARYQEGQFVVTLPQTTAEGAVYVAELIRAEVAKKAIANINSPTNYVTLSYGVASILPNHSFSTEVLLSTAFQALAEAKSQGRDRIVKKYVSFL